VSDFVVIVLVTDGVMDSFALFSIRNISFGRTKDK